MDDNLTPYIDHEVIEKLRELEDEDDDTVVDTMINIFFDDSLPLIEKIKNSTEELHFDDLSFFAHSLKGLCFNIGAKQLADICLILEIKGRKKEQEGLDEPISKIDDVYAKTCSELLKYKSTP